MNCLDVNEMIYKFCDGEASPLERVAISEHLDQCAACHHMYQLTLIENELLSETDDIPSLSPEFTSLVMNSLPSDLYLSGNPKKRSAGFNHNLGFSAITALAAVLLLVFYLPSLNIIGSKIFNNNNLSRQEQSAPSLGQNQYDKADSPDPVVLFDKSEPSKPTEIAFSASENSVKSSPVTDQSKLPSTVSAGSVPPSVMQTTAAPNVSRAINPESTNMDKSTISLRPLNIPDRLKFIQSNTDADKSVFDYASLDGKEYLQLILVPYVEPVVGSKTSISLLAQDKPTISKDIMITDQKMTVIISGNLAAEEMKSLANKIQFPNPSSN